MHVTGESFANRDPCLVLDRTEKKKKKTERKNVRSGSVRLLSRQSNVAKSSSSCVSWHGVILSFLDLATAHAWKAPATQLSTVAPRMHVTGGSFAIRVSYSIEATRKNGRKSAPSRSARLLLRKDRTCASFLSFFFFLATKSQVGGRQRKKLVANGDLATGNFEHWHR